MIFFKYFYKIKHIIDLIINIGKSIISVKNLIKKMKKNKNSENLQKNISSLRDRQAKSLRENLVKRKNQTKSRNLNEKLNKGS